MASQSFRSQPMEGERLIKSDVIWYKDKLCTETFKSDEYRAELVSSGLTQQAVDGILNISGTAYVSFAKNGANANFGNAIDAVTKWRMTMENFVKTQSKEDQDAYGKFCKKQEEEYRKRFF
ncbi:hypothetical protein GCK72_020539 [Caenorhabditis remanei]|uniref:Uncharacterized protein n=1 Tax=Caenorhabditis remanei TaxID=31234 RepID=A0A6A5GHJ8_CAERE|nr:hypothetical protein GCK72_020539 [Caenorhabditis remanei]KAF1753982.1 hypothetical protein GCK72_020539 [Caenorhabditis remanei]